MTIKRQDQICLEATPFYHCYVRCVRRAYLCGSDSATGECFDHRKQWIVSRLKFLSYVYAIDICAYAVMSNHYHVVLHVDKARALAWSREEVVERWLQLYKGHMLVDRWLAEPGALDKAQQEVVFALIEKWRERLYGIDWFMRGVNETIARMANEEENCKGRFWESRYKSQALLDEAALLSCMAYVDLNPIRAAMEPGLEESDFTAIQQRLFDYVNCTKTKNAKNAQPTQKLKVTSVVEQRVEQQCKLKAELGLNDLPESALMPFSGSSHTNIHAALPFTREEYFDLVDKTGRVLRDNKRGFIAAQVPPIIARLGINPDKWINHIQHFGRHYGCCAGAAEKMASYAQLFNRQWGKGVANSGVVYLKAG